jgi:hypothetical protein
VADAFITGCIRHKLTTGFDVRYTAQQLSTVTFPLVFFSGALIQLSTRRFEFQYSCRVVPSAQLASEPIVSVRTFWRRADRFLSDASDAARFGDWNEVLAE